MWSEHYTGNPEDFKVVQRDDVTELVKSIRNRCDIYLLLIAQEKYALLCTVLEDLYEDAQEVIDSLCIESD